MLVSPILMFYYVIPGDVRHIYFEIHECARFRAFFIPKFIFKKTYLLELVICGYL